MNVDQETAATLADVWSSYWAVSTPGNETEGDEALAKCAFRLYVLSGDVIAAYPFADASDPRIAALMILREIADGYALLSVSWSTQQITSLTVSRERVRLPLPDRARLEENLRRFGVATWCEQLGYHLDLQAPEALTDAANATTIEANDAEESAVATGVGDVIEAWDSLDGALRSDSIRPEVLAHAGRLREQTIRDLAKARLWSRYFGPRLDIGGASAISLAIIILESLIMILSVKTDRELVDLPVPSNEELADLFRVNRSAAWLERHGARLPAWLVPR